MKIRILILCLSLTSLLNSIKGQDYSDLDKIMLKDKIDCANNEDLVLECSNYLLKSPIGIIGDDQNHIKALQFVMRWMEATPDYSFTLDESMMNVTNSDPSLLGILLASMSKYVLENKDNSDDANDVKYNSFLIFIKYIEDPVNNVKLNKDMKELLKARDENTLKEYLKIRSNDLITMSEHN